MAVTEKQFMGSAMISLLDTFVVTFRQRQFSARFLTRDPMRDNRTDTERFGRLRSVIDQIISEIEAERQGLEGRYGRECRDAGLLMDAMENDRGPNAPSERLDGLTRSILHCERRLARLSLQVNLFEQLQRSLEQNISVQRAADDFYENRPE